MNNARSDARTRAKRNYKDTLFRLVFKERKELLSLYNAINDTAYTDESALEIVTLENAIYMNMKNDLAFLVDCKMNLYEHQSSVNPNMPLRDLFYVAKEYQNMVDGARLYAPALELRVIQLNISAGHNKMLMEKCPVLREYSQYIERVRKYLPEMDLDEAVERAVQECVKEGILAEFLSRNRAEAVSVCIFEYDEERERAIYGEVIREQTLRTHLTTLVQKKKAKGMSIQEVAELLEEEESTIAELWDVKEISKDYHA